MKNYLQVSILIFLSALSFVSLYLIVNIYRWSDYIVAQSLPHDENILWKFNSFRNFYKFPYIDTYQSPFIETYNPYNEGNNFKFVDEYTKKLITNGWSLELMTNDSSTDLVFQHLFFTKKFGVYTYELSFNKIGNEEVTFTNEPNLSGKKVEDIYIIEH